MAIRAGGGDSVGLDAGTVTIAPSSDSQVQITVSLENGFIFYYDLNDHEEDDNLQIQDYSEEPRGNPKIGRFASKTFVPVGSTTASILVPLNSLYGIHLDVAYPVACE